MQPTSETGPTTHNHPPTADNETAVIHLSVEGLVNVRIRDGAYQSVDDAKANLAAAVAATAGRRRPLLVDIRTAQPLDAEARHLYSGQTLVDGFLALALLVDSSPFGRMMGNVYLRIARPGIPTQLFNDEPRAVEWLMKHRG
jgi:hypothetical protein